MKPVIDLNKEYGLVLEGGGAKGAYQIGAWKALKEAGVKIKGVAGTSVGALNGAMVCMDDLEKAEKLWREIAYSKVMDVEDDTMQQIFRGELSMREALKYISHFFGVGGIDVTPLKNLILENIDEDIIRKSPVEFFILTFSVSDFKELDIDMKDVEEGLLGDLLLASAYLFPVFKNKKLHGKNYIDGGILNNVPLESLVKRGYKDIITIRIFGIGREKKVKLDDETVHHIIAPRVNLGNMMDFDSTKSKRNMKIGYYDAKRVIYGLKGKIYYIEQMEEECYYLNQLILLPDDLKQSLAQMYNLEEGADQWLRGYLEIILPIIANDLKIEKNWNYQSLYLAMLEATAKLFRVQKYKIYTVESLLESVQNKAALREMEEGEELPVFVSIILKKLYIGGFD